MDPSFARSVLFKNRMVPVELDPARMSRDSKSLYRRLEGDAEMYGFFDIVPG